MDTTKLLTRAIRYDKAVVETRRRIGEVEAANAKLEIARIEERGAELGSQAFAYVARGTLAKTLGEITDREREIGLMFVRYTVYGRTDNES